MQPSNLSQPESMTLTYGHSHVKRSSENLMTQEDLPALLEEACRCVEDQAPKLQQKYL